MLKTNKKKMTISSLVILLPMIAGLILWDKLPQQMAIHWDLNGQPNNWGGKPLVVLFIPLFLLALHWICIFVTSADPKNKGQTKKITGLIFWIFPLLSLFVGASLYTAALGIDMSMTKWALLFIGLLFIVMGNYMPKTKQNHTIGIRIKWTLENEANWNRTHRFAGKVWVIGGLLLLACAFLPSGPILYLPLILLILLVALPILYSYQHRSINA